MPAITSEFLIPGTHAPNSTSSATTTRKALKLYVNGMERKLNLTGANVIDGAALARDIRLTVASRIAALRAANPHFLPHLAIIHAGSRPGSDYFVQLKVDACAEVGIKCSVARLLGNVALKDILDAIRGLNEAEDVTGVFLQLPLGDEGSIGPEGEQIAMQTILPNKDVDGFHPYHIGRLLSRAPSPLNVPCMPNGVIRLIEKTGVCIAGAHTVILGTRAVVLGLDDLAANPLAVMLRKQGAMVTQCDSWHENMKSCLKTADIVIAAIGKPEFVRGDMLKPGCVVIDIGINYVPDAARKTGHRLVGDVHYESASKVASWITPVPGGAGPMTFAMLMDSPPLDFSFANPNATGPKKAHKQRPPSLDSARGTPYTHKPHKQPGKLAFVSADPPLGSSNPGPLIGSAESTLGTNAFKLRANKLQAPPKYSENALLRQEIFKSAHTFTISPASNSSLVAAPGMLRTPSPASAPLQPSSKSTYKSSSQVLDPYPASLSFIQFDPPSVTKPHARGAGPERDSHQNRSAHDTATTSRECDVLEAPGSEEQESAQNNTVDTTGPMVDVPLQRSACTSTLSPEAPSRHSIDRKTPAIQYRSAPRNQCFGCLELQGQLDTAGKKVAILEHQIDEKAAEIAKFQEKVQKLQSLLDSGREEASILLSQLNELRQNGAAVQRLHTELEKLRQQTRDVTQALEQSQSISKDKYTQLHGVISEYQDKCNELEDNLSRQRGVSDLLREELSLVRGSYSEALDSNTELKSLLNSMSADQTDMFKSLAELSKQMDNQSIQCLELRASEASSAERVKSLELSVSTLTKENTRAQNLMVENEKAFANKLKHLEAENEALSRSLEIARAEQRESSSLDSLRRSQEEASAQIETQRREDHEAKEQISQLTRELALKSQSLSEAHKTNELSCHRLAEAERILVQAGMENGVLQGRIVELERVCSVSASHLKDSQDQLTKSNDELSVLRERMADAVGARDKIDALQSALSTAKLKSEGQASEIVYLNAQLGELKRSLNVCAAERESLLGVVGVSEEREARHQFELQTLRSQIDHHRTATQQVNGQLTEAQELRRVAEQKIQDLIQKLHETRSEHNDFHELEVEKKRLESELSATLFVKVTLENALSDLRKFNQQEVAARRDLEHKLEALTEHASEQKIEISSLKQQIQAATARNFEREDEVNKHRSDAENARASLTLLEHRLKESELELRNLSTKIPALEAAAAESISSVDSTLKDRVSQQAATIEKLNSTIEGMQKNVATISERYRDGRLVDSEKRFITEITTALIQEKDKVMNGLRGEIKRKDNEIASNKAIIATQKQSMANYIGQIDALKMKLEDFELHSRTAVEVDGLATTMLEIHQLPSSSLSEASAPDHDEPAPDTPTISSNLRNSSGLTVNSRQMPMHTIKPKNQHRTFADIERGHSSPADEIQDFEEPEPSRPDGSRRKRRADIEPAEDSEGEQVDNKRKCATKTKKSAKAGDSSVTVKDVVNTRGKAGKRRRV